MLLQRPFPGLSPFRRIEISTELIADLCRLQQNIEDELAQDDNTDEERQTLRRLLSDARNDVEAARHSLEVLTRTT